MVLFLIESVVKLGDILDSGIKLEIDGFLFLIELLGSVLLSIGLIQ